MIQLPERRNKEMEFDKQLSAKLTNANLKKCGIGTKNACFALSLGLKRMGCLMVKTQQGDNQAQQLMNIAGMRLGWRVNVDPADGKAWCPKGVLNNSKL